MNEFLQLEVPKNLKMAEEYQQTKTIFVSCRLFIFYIHFTINYNGAYFKLRVRGRHLGTTSVCIVTIGSCNSLFLLLINDCCLQQSYINLLVIVK